jgi:hypothetical protein
MKTWNAVSSVKSGGIGRWPTALRIARMQMRMAAPASAASMAYAAISSGVIGRASDIVGV